MHHLHPLLLACTFCIYLYPSKQVVASLACRTCSHPSHPLTPNLICLYHSFTLACSLHAHSYPSFLLMPFAPTQTICAYLHPLHSLTTFQTRGRNPSLSCTLLHFTPACICFYPLSSFIPNLAFCTHLHRLMPACTCSCPSHLLVVFGPFILTLTCS